MSLGTRHLLAPGLLALLSMTACGDDRPVRLEVTVQDWTGWSEAQPEQVVTSHELSEGDSFTVDVIGDDEVVVTVVRIDGGEVELETSEPMAVTEDGGGADLRHPRTELSLDRGGSVGFVTPTPDGGTRVSVAER